MEDLVIRRITNEDDLRRAFRLREVVFMDEQGVSEAAEFDGLDDQCDHMLAVIGDRAVGTLRIRKTGHRQAKIERVVVAKRDRGRQIGAKLMAVALQLMPELGVQSVKLHAQTHAERFYAKLGFVAEGDIFIEDGIPHIVMCNHLAQY